MRYAAELPRGVIRPLYEAARDVQGGEPLIYQAAQALLEHVGQRDTVLIVTGSGSRFGRLVTNDLPHQPQRHIDSG